MKQLEELLNLTPEDDDNEVEPVVDIAKAKHDVDEVLSIMADTDKIDAALPMVDDLADNDREMDDLAKKAAGAFKDLFDLGMNVDTKYSGRIFEVAASMLGHELTAKTQKIDKKLRVIDLQIKKARLDQNAGKAGGDQPADGEGTIVDRNELLAELLKKTEQ